MVERGYTNLPSCNKVWTTLVTNTDYIEGVYTLNYSLKRVGSNYPLVAIYTDGLSRDGLQDLVSRGIYVKSVDYLLPTAHKDYSQDTRFYDCWSKLQPFSMTEFERVCQLDSDMVVVRNMDELMEIPLDAETAPFAASHACTCNPYKKPHYPKDWTVANCAYTNYHVEGAEDWRGPSNSAGLAICNGGLQVVIPSKKNYAAIAKALEDPKITQGYDFADQSLLSDVFRGKWVALSYKYNALKTLNLIHRNVWNDDEVKNIHYILNPKPWNTDDDDDTGTFKVWQLINRERLQDEGEVPAIESLAKKVHTKVKAVALPRQDTKISVLS